MRLVVTRLRSMSNVFERQPVSYGDTNTHYSKSLTKMSIAVYILFVVLITPSIIIWTVNSYPSTRTGLVYFDVTNIFVFSHHSLNFYLFFLTGPRFRREVMGLFGETSPVANDSRDNSNKPYSTENCRSKEVTLKQI